MLQVLLRVRIVDPSNYRGIHKERYMMVDAGDSGSLPLNMSYKAEIIAVFSSTSPAESRSFGWPKYINMQSAAPRMPRNSCYSVHTNASLTTHTIYRTFRIITLAYAPVYPSTQPLSSIATPSPLKSLLFHCGCLEENPETPPPIPALGLLPRLPINRTTMPWPLP